MTKCNKAIFLGAGFSKDADLPIMSEFAKYSANELQSLKDKHGPNSNSPRNAATLLINKGELFEGFRRYCIDHKPPELKSFSTDNMEDLFTIAEIMYQCGKRNIEINGERILMEDLLNAIKFWLWNIYQRIPIHNPPRYKIKIEPYEIFINTLYEYGLNKVSIITTNYDMILEYLFHQKGIQVCYPLNDAQFEFNDLCAPAADRIATCLSKSDNKSPILCKLHGSINFFVSELSNKKLQIIADTAEKPIGKSSLKKNAPSIMAVDAIHELSINKKLVPAIIPPTYAKLENSDWLREIWQHAADVLSSASKWIFIGYSFPRSDGFMKSLINLSLIFRKQPSPEIIVIDPDLNGNIEINCEYFFGKNFHLEKKKFSEVIDSGFIKKMLLADSART